MRRQAHLLTLAGSPYLVMPESVGAYRDFPDHSVLREAGVLNNFNIHYVAAGKGYAETETGVHELRAGDAVLYFPLQRQRYYSSEDEPWDVRWVHFYGEELRDYLVRLGFHQSAVWSLRQREAWESAHLALLEEAEAHQLLRPVRLSMLTYALFSEFVQQAVPVSDVKSAGTDRRILDLLPDMQREACAPFILEDWAARAGVSRHYFCKLFRQAMGFSPMDFVTRCRLQAAKQWLLEHPALPVGRIAEDAGYPSASYFNKRFSEHEGVTPTEYRRLFGKA